VGACSLSAGYALASGTLTLGVTVHNNAGHKVPTGIPIRRMWLHVRVVDDQGTPVFESGAWDGTGEIVGLDATFEPHHDQIDQPDQVQIYEGVMHDVNNTLTHTLLRAAGYSKDNRIPPRGSVASHRVYDTVATFGAATGDANFNAGTGGEGSGTDSTTYSVSVGNVPRCTVQVALAYQSTTPRFVAHLSGFGLPETDLYAGLHAAEPVDPVIIDSLRFVADAPVGVVHRATGSAVASIRPCATGQVGLWLPESRRVSATAMDARGRVVLRVPTRHLARGTHRIGLAGVSSGVYTVTVRIGETVHALTMLLP
jgi:hypothetical protein